MAKILIAEDDSSMRQFLSMALKRAGHDVVLCEDGLKAFHALRDAPTEYDLLLTDIVMPGMDGIELSKKAPALNPALKIMFITGFAAVAAQEEQRSGFLPGRVLAKPFHLKDLTDQIESFLGGGNADETS